MSFKAIQDGLIETIKLGPSFDDSNAVFYDIDVLSKLGEKNCAAIVEFGPSSWSVSSFGSTTSKVMSWGLYLNIWVEYETPGQFSSDAIEVLDEVFSYLRDNDTLQGSCDEFSARLTGLSAEEGYDKYWGRFVISIEASEF